MPTLLGVFERAEPRPADVHLFRYSTTAFASFADLLAAFVRDQNAGSSDRPCFVGHNAVFDWSYIAYYYAHFAMENPFRGRLSITSKPFMRCPLMGGDETPPGPSMPIRRRDGQG